MEDVEGRHHCQQGTTDLSSDKQIKKLLLYPQVYNRNEVFWGRVAFEHSNLQGIYLKVKLLRLSDASVITECEQSSEHC